MQFSLKIQQIGSQKDLTIIYKECRDQLYEVKANKEDFIRALRYYEKKKK